MNVLRIAFGVAVLLLVLGPATSVRAANAFNSAYISEILADNEKGSKDDEGNRSGWIELHNGGASPVNLSGWFLTDNPTNLTKWRFPGVVLLPEKFMVVFASAKDRANDLAHLHTNFRLNKQGGYLALVNPATNIVSEFSPAYPKQSTDISFGSVRGEPVIRGAFARPTPGKPNMSSGKGFAPEVTFSKASGSFSDEFTLALSTSSTGAVIRYSMDGTLPTSTSLVYGASFDITNSAYIRARAFQEGLLPGPPHSEGYLRLLTNVVEFTSTLPVLVMETFGRNLRTSSEDSFAHLSLHEPINGKTSLTNPPTLTTRAGFHVRGSTSSGFPQTPFAVEFLDEFNEEQNLSPLGLPADSDWVLYAPNMYDPVMLHNPFIHQLSRDMGRYSPRTRFVEVFLSRSRGRVRDIHYHGIYVLTEKIKLAKERVNIDRVGAEDLNPPDVTGGYLLKFDRVGAGESGVFGGGDRGLVYAEPKEATITLPQRTPQREYVQKYMSDFIGLLRGPKWKDPKTGYRAYLDVDAAIDFHVLEVLSGNVDAMVLSTYFYKPRNGKITFGPHWDFDRAMGSIDERDTDPRVWNTGPFFNGTWWPVLFRDPDFWQQWVDRWQELRRSHFSVTNMNRLIDQLAAEVREAQPREYQKWGLQPRGGTYQGEIDHMKDWLSNRVDFIDRQLVQPPRFKSEGGSVAPGFALKLSARSSATIYYTLDGSDPRLSQGAISSNALVYSNSIPVNASAHVFARTHNVNIRQVGGPPVSTPWSGPVAIKLEVAEPK